MHTEKQIRWRETHLLTADKKDLARFVLDEIRRGRDVTNSAQSSAGGWQRLSQQVHAGFDLQ